jgi:hypothetical protein
MPRGLVRTDLNNTGTDYLHGNPVTEPVVFGTPVTIPHDFGNDVTLPKNFGNVVNWQPAPSHFGNVFGPSGGVSITTLSAAQVSTLNSNPVLVVPGISGYVPIIESGYMIYVPGTLPYTVSPDDAIALYVGDGTPDGSIINYAELPADNFIDAFNPDKGIYIFTPSYQWTTPSSIPHVPTSSLSGHGIYLNQWASPFPTGTNWTGGNGTIKIVIEYNYIGA